MKIIDLLNKIANGEEVPKKIKYGEYYYCYEKKYNEDWEEWECGYKTYTGGYLNIWREKALNDEVEIIEEKEMCHKCHKYPAEYNQTWCEFCLGISKEEKEIPEKLEILPDNEHYSNEILYGKINEIIDYLKSKGDE